MFASNFWSLRLKNQLGVLKTLTNRKCVFLCMQWIGKATKGLYQIDPGLDGIGRKGLELFNSSIVKYEKNSLILVMT